MKDKKRGSPAVKHNDPQRMTEVKRQLNFKSMRVRNQQVILKFSREYRQLSFDECGSILLFVSWLQDNKYIIRRKN